MRGLLLPRRSILVLLALWLGASPLGCISLDNGLLRPVARVLDFGSRDVLEVRKKRRSAWSRNPFGYRKSAIAQPSPRTQQQLRLLDLEDEWAQQPLAVLRRLGQYVQSEPTPEIVYAAAELSYLTAQQPPSNSRECAALDLYSTAVVYSYIYLFDHRLDRVRNPYDSQFHGASELYNKSLENLLRIANQQGQLKPGLVYNLQACGTEIKVAITLRGPWNNDDFESFEFVSDYNVAGLRNKHQTFGLGVPLIAIRKKHEGATPSEKYYPPGLSFPVTAFLRVLPSSRVAGADSPPAVHCTLELVDPMETKEVEVAGRRAPLESDLSTPLAYYLNDPVLHTSALATFNMLNVDFGKQMGGLHMLEPYRPDRIPVVMVHGLWASPVTWMEMFNDLRADPQLRDQYQFWFYLYPTGQPFWLSAKQMREDLARAQQELDPHKQSAGMDHMVLVGHSMGGLVSKMQTIESRNEFWQLLSDRPFDELKAEPGIREQLGSTLFFRPNPSVRRVITIATPHRGSRMANRATRWLGRTLIKMPEMLAMKREQVLRENPDFFRDTDLLTIHTSIDSLSPNCQMLSAVERAKSPPWVTYHNIVGQVSKPRYLGRFGEAVPSDSDGVVSVVNARQENVASEILVDSQHQSVHQHPRAILEVRRILLNHLAETQAEWSQVRRAGHQEQSAGNPRQN